MRHRGMMRPRLEGVVAVGIKEHETQFGGLQRFEDAPKRNRFLLNVILAANLSVDREHVVLVADLSAVPGVEHHRDFGILRRHVQNRAARA